MNESDKCCLGGIFDPGKKFIEENGPVYPEGDYDTIVFAAPPETVHSYSFVHDKEFTSVAQCECCREYIFGPDGDNKTLIICVEGVEWLHVGKNGHVLVQSTGSVLFIPYGWLAMRYSPKDSNTTMYVGR